ncbi:MAG: hypothetical protein HQK54_16825, partial [Oligoflexales bacterium]|nr:hypothetical protein [Oligoflexales bacterium]
MKRLVFKIRIKEPISALSHFLGIFLAVAALVLLVTYAAIKASPIHIISFSIFGAFAILL